MSQWNAALDAYLEVAGKALGGLYFGRKGAAETVCRQFGRPLCAESAQLIKEFLRSLQIRLDMQSVIESITGETFPRRPSDEELLGEFRRHRAVVAALSKPPSGPRAAGELAIPDEHVVAVNGLIASSAGPASKVLANYGFETSPAAFR